MVKALSFWTAERDKQLAHFWELGLPIKEIAHNIGATTYNAVVGRARRLGLPKHPRLKANRSRTPDRKRAPQGAVFERAAIAKSAPLFKPAGPIVPPMDRLTARVPAPKMLPLLALTPSRCHWPIGDPKQPNFGFCGHPVSVGRFQYCAGHQEHAIFRGGHNRG